MIVEILKPYGKWQIGATPDVTNELGNALIAAGIARAHEDQTRRDYTPKPPPQEAEPQKIEVHNYFIAPEEEEAPKPRKTKKG